MCLLLLTWSISVITCCSCYSFGTFLSLRHTHAQKHTLYLPRHGGGFGTLFQAPVFRHVARYWDKDVMLYPELHLYIALVPNTRVDVSYVKDPWVFGLRALHRFAGQCAWRKEERLIKSLDWKERYELCWKAKLFTPNTNFCTPSAGLSSALVQSRNI